MDEERLSGYVPEWDAVHGKHRFVEGSWNGPEWCALCDCLRQDHIIETEPAMEQKKPCGLANNTQN